MIQDDIIPTNIILQCRQDQAHWNENKNKNKNATLLIAIKKQTWAPEQGEE